MYNVYAGVALFPPPPPGQLRFCYCAKTKQYLVVMYTSISTYAGIPWECRENDKYEPKYIYKTGLHILVIVLFLQGLNYMYILMKYKIHL